MAEQTRRRLALLALAVSAVGLIATSPPSGTLSTVDGESVVGVGRTTGIDVRFQVSPARSPVQRVDVRLDIPRHTTRNAMEVVPSVRVDGALVPVQLDGSLLGPGGCQEGCAVDVHVDLRPIGPSEPDTTIRWSIGLFVNAGSPDAVTVVASTQHPPAGSDRFVWYAVGLALGLATIAVWARAGSRFRTARLGLAAGSVAVVGWLLLYEGGSLLFAMGLGVGLAVSVVPLLALAVLAIAVSIGLWRHLKGHGLWLAATGWIYVLLGALLTIASVASATAYRPIEVALLGLAVTAPGAAALTSPGLLGPDRRPRAGEVLLTAAQVLLIGGNAVLVIGLVPAVLSVGFADGRSALEAPGGFALAIGSLVLLVWGLRRWRRGARGLLVTVNVLLSLLFGFALFLAVAAVGFLGPTILVPPSVLLVASLIGVVAGASSRPTSVTTGPAVEGDSGIVAPATGPSPAEKHRDEQGG